jgi:lipoprotein-anchoring transpeptidase ErfK/SrfK
MASKSRNESSKPRSQRALAPALLLLALVGVLVWGLWRVLGPEKRAASKPEAEMAKEASKVPVEPVSTQGAAEVAAPTKPVQPPPAPGVPTVVPVPPAAPPVPAPAPISVPSALSPLLVVSNAAPALVGPTSAPVVLSTQILRASVVLPELSISNSGAAWVPRGATNYLEAQIALAGLGISSGSIDGVGGAQTAFALKAFQSQQGLQQTGWLDRNTRKALMLKRAPWAPYRVSAEDLLRLAPLPETWVGKSQVPGLEHETLLERLAERFQTHPALLRRLNPAADWVQPAEGLELTVPSVPPIAARRAGLIRIHLSGRYLRVLDTAGELIAHFPCSIARRVEKRPVGDLQVVVTVPNPDYTWDPEVFPESPESRTVGRKLRIPPGPNNPVGVAWIGLNRTGYGIHGTPKPEDVGRTESHGCFRLANWNAELLRRMAWPGLPVRVEGEAPPVAASVASTVSTATNWTNPTASTIADTNTVKAPLSSVPGSSVRVPVGTNTAQPVRPASPTP